MAKIEHLFVLMMENRSFDHLLAFSGLPGVTPPPAKFGFSPGAVDQLANDPHHEFPDVAAQINGGAMDGFLRNNGPDAMLGFDETEVPVLIELAKNNLYFDNWFSSMPGPTWPNRLFAHAASSGGLDNSLPAFDAYRAVTNPGYALLFQNGHVFDRLTAKNVSWRIYHHHGGNIDFPQVLSLKGMVEKGNDPHFFRHFNSFASDVAAGDVAAYTVIEPKYDLPGYSNGNSQHPVGTISGGEFLIKAVHKAIFTQKAGDHSALLVTWDEHGGFFDQVTPPHAAPPGDLPLNHARAKAPGNCPFDRFGVRVPAVLVSPWLPAGRSSHILGNKPFDHSSIVRALRTTFSLGGKLTNRDDASPDWNSALLTKPRTVSLKLPSVTAPKRGKAPDLKEIARRGPPSGNVLGTAQIAVDVDWHSAERLRVAPLVTSEFQETLFRASDVLSDRSGQATDPKAVSEAHLSVLEYLAAVSKRNAKLRTAERKKATVARQTPRAVKGTSVKGKRKPKRKK